MYQIKRVYLEETDEDQAAIDVAWFTETFVLMPEVIKASDTVYVVRLTDPPRAADYQPAARPLLPVNAVWN
jgi:hypothetical protein